MCSSDLSFFAGLLGVMFPFWFLAGYAFTFNHLEMIYHTFQTLITFEPVNLLVLKSWQVATISYIILLFVVGVANSLINGWQDKIRTRAYLNF